MKQEEGPWTLMFELEHALVGLEGEDLVDRIRSY